MSSRSEWRVPAVWLALGAAACAPALDWRELKPEGSGVALLMPCKPKQASRTVTLAGANVKLALAACDAGDQIWALAHADVQDPARVTPALRELLASAAANIGAAGSTPLPLAVRGATPNDAAARVELRGKMPDGKAVVEQVAVFARGTVVLQATALGATLPAEAADTFFGSLRGLP